MNWVFSDCSIRVTVVSRVSQPQWLSCKFATARCAIYLKLFQKRCGGLVSFLICWNEAEGSRTKWLPLGHVYYLCCHAHFDKHFTCILHSKYCIYTYPVPLEYLNNVVMSRYAAQGKRWLWKINLSIWFCCLKNSLMEGKRNGKAQREHTCRNPKRHILPVSLFLCCKMVAVCCFICDPVWENRSYCPCQQIQFFIMNRVVHE